MFRPVDTPTAADFFCGGGGASEGVLGAGVELRFAANHDAVAIATHAHRHPSVDHYQVDLVDYDVAKMPRVQMAHFSPSCVHHSQANATKVYGRAGRHRLPRRRDPFGTMTTPVRPGHHASGLAWRQYTPVCSSKKYHDAVRHSVAMSIVVVRDDDRGGPQHDDGDLDSTVDPPVRTVPCDGPRKDQRCGQP